MKVNVAQKFTEKTHEGAQAARTTPEQQLRRSVAACLLWEDSFYESGEDIAKRIASLIPLCRPEFVAACAFEARTKMKLRHVPLLLVREMARLPQHKALVGKLLPDVIQRADEITEFLALYWKGGRQKVSKQVKLGLAAAFLKFNEYALAKYNRDGAVKLRDALFLCHAKPDTPEREALWKRLIDGKLVTPDTWEVALSGGADKKATFERLMAEKQLGALAFLRNLRNMKQAGVSDATLAGYAGTLNVERVLPFRFIAAARVMPQLEPILEPLMLQCAGTQEMLTGKTVLLVDVSGSMDHPISSKSDLQRVDAACGVAMLLREVCEEVLVVTFSNTLVQVPPRRGFALRDAVVASQPHQGTYLAATLKAIHDNPQNVYDRIVVITDEQSADGICAPRGKAYCINVASNKNGVGYGAWHHIDGWSESVIEYVRASESQDACAA